MMLFFLSVCLLLLLLSLLLVVELVSAAFSCTSPGVLHGDVGGVLYRYTGASSDQWTQRRLADYVIVRSHVDRWIDGGDADKHPLSVAE